MDNFEYNLDNNLRISILLDRDLEGISEFIEKELKIYGGVLDFEIDIETIQKLIDNGFVDVEDTQNEAPSIKEFIDFTKKYPLENFYFIGYAVMPPRSDYRISIEGLTVETDNRNLVVDFTTFFKNADNLSYSDDELYCWYD